MKEAKAIEWFKFFGWSDNPFKIRPDPNHIAGFVDLRAKILTYLKSEDPFIVTGPTGAGKTTLLKWLERHKENALYFNFLENIDEREFKKKVRGGFFERIKMRLSGKKRILLLDEVQCMSPELLRWIRAKFDEGDISALVLTSIKKDLENLEEAFLDRIGKRIVHVRKLTEDEAFKMVRQRIYSKGTNNPFTKEALKAIFKYSDFSPRKILENCEACCIHAVKEGLKYINTGVVEEVLKEKEKPAQIQKRSGPSIMSLSPRQREILKILAEENLTTPEIAKRLGASRASIAKQLSRLSFKTDKKILISKGFSSPLVEVKGSGRPVIYGLTEEGRKLLKNA